jgi:hypothetical protein
VAYLTGYYKDGCGRYSALAVLTVWYKENSNTNNWKFLEIIYMKLIKSGTTMKATYTLKDLGYYQFSWTVFNLCEICEVRTKVGPVFPEASTVAGLAASLAALGIVFARKRFK